MEGGEFAEAERARMRELWRVPCMGLVQREQRSTYLDVRFKIELAAVPDDDLLRRTIDFLKSGMPARLWEDNIGSGVIGDLDLNPIQEVLKTNSILHPGPVFDKLLTGSYRRYDSMIEAGRLKYAKCPHYVDALDLAVVARWSSLSEAAIDKKARDIQGKNWSRRTGNYRQMFPVSSISVSQALSGDLVERRRYDQIVDRAFAFDRDGSRRLEIGLPPLIPLRRRLPTRYGQLMRRFSGWPTTAAKIADRSRTFCFCCPKTRVRHVKVSIGMGAASRQRRRSGDERRPNTFRLPGKAAAFLRAYQKAVPDDPWGTSKAGPTITPPASRRQRRRLSRRYRWRSIMPRRTLCLARSITRSIAERRPSPNSSMH